MDLEQPAPVLDSVAGNTAPDPEATPLDPSNAELQQQQAIEDEIEEELEGVKIRGNKELVEKIKAERLMQADYTRKTQEVAEQRRAIEAQAEQHRQQVEFQRQFQDDIADLRALDKRIGQLQGYMRQHAGAIPPEQAQALLMELNGLQADKAQVAGSLTQKQQQLNFRMQQDIARRVQEGRAVLERDIKGWSPELQAKLLDFGVQVGIPRQMLESVTQPAFVKLLHKAYLADLAEKQQKPAALPKPAARVTGAGAANAKPLSDVTDPYEWRDRRAERKSKTR